MRGHAATLLAAEARATADRGRAEEAVAAKTALCREAGATRAELVSSRERAVVLEKLLTRSSEQMRKMQLTAGRHEGQMRAEREQRERSWLEALEAERRQHADRIEQLERQVSKYWSLYEVAERRATELHGLLLAQRPGSDATVTELAPMVASL